MNLILCLNYQKVSVNGGPINEASQQGLLAAYLCLHDTRRGEDSSGPGSGLCPEVPGSLETYREEAAKLAHVEICDCKATAPGNCARSLIHSFIHSSNQNIFHIYGVHNREGRVSEALWLLL